MMELLSACGYASLPKFTEKEELVKMIARYEVLDKPRSALKQFKEGLSTLDVLHVMKQHPAEFENLFCHQGKALSASEIDRTFLPMLDPVGCNARDRQELVLMHWRDYLQETEGAVEKLKYECTFCPDHCHCVHGRRMGDLKMGGTTS